MKVAGLQLGYCSEPSAIDSHLINSACTSHITSAEGHALPVRRERSSSVFVLGIVEQPMLIPSMGVHDPQLCQDVRKHRDHGAGQGVHNLIATGLPGRQRSDSV